MSARINLLLRIERHLRRSGTPPTVFGRRAVKDPRFVLDLRKGRDPRPGTISRVATYLDRAEREPIR